MLLRCLLILALLLHGLPLGVGLPRSSDGAKRIVDQVAALPVSVGEAQSAERAAPLAVGAAPQWARVIHLLPRVGNLRHVPEHVIPECARRGMRTSGRHPPVDRHV